jgi:hypothetical protein
VLRAKKLVLQFVCRDYCHIPVEELNGLTNKVALYDAAAAWVCEMHFIQSFISFPAR